MFYETFNKDRGKLIFFDYNPDTKEWVTNYKIKEKYLSGKQDLIWIGTEDKVGNRSYVEEKEVFDLNISGTKGKIGVDPIEKIELEKEEVKTVEILKFELQP